MMIIQKLKSPVKSAYSIAEKYYSIISAVNDLELTTREIQLVSFTAVRGNMSYANIRDDFCKEFNTSSPTINNIISKLKKRSLLVKDNGKIKVNPVLALDFKQDVKLEIMLMQNNGKQ